jgi:hypothetical protein
MLCQLCHEVKHIGRAINEGYGQRAAMHLMAVNQWSEAQVNRYLNAAMKQWKKRSEHEWTVDISWIDEDGGSAGRKEKT